MIFIVLLITTSVTAIEVGETIDLIIPDISYFPEEQVRHQFTCRAVTDNAYWFVQDTTYIDLPDTSETYQIIWENLITSAELDSITAQFEGAGVDVYGTITNLFGHMPDTPNQDDRIWIAFSDVPDYYPNPQGPPSRLGSWVYVWPEDFDGNGITGNNHDLIYVNLGVYKNQQGGIWEVIRGSVHTWSVPTGLGQILRVAHNYLEERWLVRGIGMFSQFLCYGLTSTFNGNVGIEAAFDDFATAGGIELTSWCSGQKGSDFAENLGGELLWFLYLEQRIGPDLIRGIVQSELSGMPAIAYEIDPTIPDSVAVSTNIYPLYEDWLITNLVAHVAGDFAGGIYRYDRLDEVGYEFTIMDSPASFLGEFYSYPIPTWIAPLGYGISAQVFAAQYASFDGDYSSGTDRTVHFNGMYNQNDGSGSNLDASWIAYRIVLSDDSILNSVDSLEFSPLFNGTFQLDGSRTFLLLTNNNPGGTAQLRYALSQDTSPRSLYLTTLQNGMNQQYLQVYTSLLTDESRLPYGFDWVGPKLEISHLDEEGAPDSTATEEMIPLSSTIWTGRAYAWEAGSYSLVCSGFDSLGLSHRDSLLFAVGYGGTGKLQLDIGTARLDVPEAGLPAGSMASLSEMDSQWGGVSSEATSVTHIPLVTGLDAGPVSVSPVEGILSFASEDPALTILHFDEGQWVAMESYILAGRTCTIIRNGGIYALGEGSGTTSPEIPGEFVQYGGSPNPFISNTSVNFSIPEHGAVELRIYDLSGRLVDRMMTGMLDPGMHSIHWSGEDRSGGPVPSGIYLCVLESMGQITGFKITRME